MDGEGKEIERCGWCNGPAVTRVKIAHGTGRGHHYAWVCAAREARFAEQGVESEDAKLRTKKKVYKGPKLGWR